MTATIPQTPETLSDLAKVLMADEDVLAVDICEDESAGFASSWAEVTTTSLVVPDVVVREVGRSYAPFSLYDVDHRDGHTIVTIFGPTGAGTEDET